MGVEIVCFCGVVVGVWTRGNCFVAIYKFSLGIIDLGEEALMLVMLEELTEEDQAETGNNF